MQAAQSCANPVLIRVEVQGSHGYRPTDKLIAERADEWAFAAANMGMKSIYVADRSFKPGARRTARDVNVVPVRTISDLARSLFA